MFFHGSKDLKDLQKNTSKLSEDLYKFYNCIFENIKNQFNSDYDSGKDGFFFTNNGVNSMVLLVDKIVGDHKEMIKSRPISKKDIETYVLVKLKSYTNIEANNKERYNDLVKQTHKGASAAKDILAYLEESIL